MPKEQLTNEEVNLRFVGRLVSRNIAMNVCFKAGQWRFLIHTKQDASFVISVSILGLLHILFLKLTLFNQVEMR